MANVAQDILAYCSSCKLDLYHTVIATDVKSNPIKVKCNTCKKDHRYSPPKGAKDGTAVFKAREEKTEKKEVAKASSKSVEVEWREAMSKQKGAQAKPYSFKTTYIVGDVIVHSTFGDGVVRKLIHPNKIEVLFSMDVKTLVHDKK